jgi:predicted DNA-binding transcriptional regulator YafY
MVVSATPGSGTVRKRARDLRRGDTRPPMERMMRIHQAIRAGAYPNATTLSRQLEVSVKSVQRDLEFMRDRLELPIAYDSRRYGYHYTGEVSAFPSLQITEGELFALLVAEKALQQYRGTNFEKPLVSAFKKMAASLPDTVSLHLADWDQAISFRTSAMPILDLETFDALARAAARREQLEIVYRKPGMTKGETRVIDPYQLANINGEWFLFAFDHLRNDLRTFAPTRIQSARSTGRSFDRPRRFSIDERLRDSFGVLSGGESREVVIRFNAFAAEFIREKRWHPSQKMKVLKGGGIELRLKLSSLIEVQRWVLSWGGNAVVVSPPELLEMVRDEARRIVDAYAERPPR